MLKASALWSRGTTWCGPGDLKNYQTEPHHITGSKRQAVRPMPLGLVYYREWILGSIRTVGDMLPKRVGSNMKYEIFIHNVYS